MNHYAPHGEPALAGGRLTGLPGLFYSSSFPTPSKGKEGPTPILPLPLLQGTLDLLVLRTLVPGTSHGYGIATAVRERTGGDLSIEDAALYQALHRLERQRLIEAEWGPSENNRRARFYTLTPAGRKRLQEDAATWRRYSRAVEAVLQGG